MSQYICISYLKIVLVGVNQISQNYTFTFTLTDEPADLTFNLLIDSNLPSVSYTCNSKCNCKFMKKWLHFLYLEIVDTTYICSFLLPDSSGVSLGYHNITIQVLLDETVYGEITERFFVFIRMYTI